MTFDPNDPETARAVALVFVVCAVVCLWGAYALWA